MKPGKLLLSSALFLALALHASAAVLYVDVNSANPMPPYTNWATAATNIQDAVDTASAGDEVVVTNGLYAVGEKAGYDGWLSTGFNRVAITSAMILRSVNGPQFTVIDGGGAVRCAYLTNGASLCGFTLTNGWTDGGQNGWSMGAAECGAGARTLSSPTV